MKIAGVKGIVWDLDGTLLDSFKVFSKILAEVVSDNNLVMPSEETILHNFHGSLEECLGSMLGINSVTELEKLVELFLSKQDSYYSGDSESYLYKDALDLAQACAKQGIEQLLLTNRGNHGRGPASPSYIIAATTLKECIREIRAGDEVEYRKPDKRSMGDWLERHGLNPEDVLIIGDQFVDAQLALNLGARAVIIERNGKIPHLDSLTHKNHASVILVDNLESIEVFKKD